MNKRLVFFVFCLCLITSCTKHSPEYDSSVVNIPIPKTLTLETEMPTVYPSDLTVYEAASFKPSVENIYNVFLQDPVTEISDYLPGFGVTYYSEKAFLMLYDEYGCADYRVTDSSREAFLPTLNGTSLKQYVIRAFPFEGPYDWDNVAGGEYLLYPDSLFTDMSEHPLVRDSLEKLQSCHYPDVKLLQTEVYTKEMMQTNLSTRNNYVQKWNELAKKNVGSDGFELVDYHFTEDNEFTRVRFIQTIDGIPLTVSHWTYDTCYHPLITFTYDHENVLREFSAAHIVEKGEAGNTVQIISPQEAFMTYLEDYSAALHFGPTIIYDIQLEYVLLGDFEEELWLRPVWSFYTKKYVEPFAGSSDEGRDWVVYEYLSVLVTADTGVILMDRMDRR